MYWTTLSICTCVMVHTRSHTLYIGHEYTYIRTYIHTYVQSLKVYKEQLAHNCRDANSACCRFPGCPVDGLCSSIAQFIALLRSMLVARCAAAGGCCLLYAARCCGSGGGGGGGGGQYEAIPLVDIEQRRAAAEPMPIPGRSSAAEAAAGSPVKYYRSVHRGPPPGGAQPAASSSSSSNAAGRVVVL